MPFIPHNTTDLQAMLEYLNISSIEDLFQEIPKELRCGQLTGISPSLSEMEIAQLMQHRAKLDGQPLCFIGAGAYEHHIPAAVWQLATRGEFYSAYTPYQAEASQGTLQLLYEYQSMMSALTGMEVSNASLYDGASALGEAILMAVRANKRSKSRKILIPRSIHPNYRKVAHSIVSPQGIKLIEIPFVTTEGYTDPAILDQYADQDITALVIPQPNFFGILEEVDTLTAWARQHGALSIAVVNPLALALLKPPGEWDTQGVDICCGEGQPLGIPLSSGGPYFGFMCTALKHVRQMPGRIVGATLDRDGKTGYTLTLQAREQHIRRSKATSNICTNQGLMVTAATIYMALMGATGLERMAAACHANIRALTEKLCTIPGVTSLFQRPVFHEQVLKLPIAVPECLNALAKHDILGGYSLQSEYPELKDTLLICATELRTSEDINLYHDTLAQVLV
ncbi:glycine dehydrogenase [Achromatium sp. WMS3]|nr:glycine dehydrogenase [Achromatium sp. WMS3]